MDWKRIVAERSMKSDELLLELRKLLDKPFSNYSVAGHYNFHGEENKFNGSFDIDANGKVVGTIYDPNSRCRQHVVDGQASYNGNRIVKFTKIPSSGLFVPIYYEIVRIDSGEVIEGQYRGIWQFEEPDDVMKLDFSQETETENGVEIIMHKIA